MSPSPQPEPPARARLRHFCTGPKMASSNTLHAKIAPIFTLRFVLAPKSSKSPAYAYLSRRLCFKIVEIPSLRGRSKFLHAQNILHARLLNFRCTKIFDSIIRTKIFDTRDEKFSGSTHPTFRTSRDATYAVKMAYQHNRQKIFWGGQPTLAFFAPPTGAYRIFWIQFSLLWQPSKLPKPMKNQANPRKSSLFR